MALDDTVSSLFSQTKQFLKILTLTAFMGTTLYFLQSCGGGPTGPDPKPNTKPKIESVSPVSSSVNLKQGQSQDFVVVGSDADGDKLDYSFLLDSSLVDSDSVYTFLARDMGSYVLQGIVSDGKADVYRNWTITVSDSTTPNVAPIITGLFPGQDTTIYVNDTITLDLTATDANNDVIVKTANGMNLPVLFSSDTVGSFVFTYRASDGTLHNDSTRTITVVNEPNAKPVITNYLPLDTLLTVNQGDTINFSLLATDTDSLSYQILKNSLPVGTDNYQWIASDIGQVLFTGIASDGSLTDSIRWHATVQDTTTPNTPPYFTFVPQDTTIVEGDSVFIEAFAADNEDPVVIQYVLNNDTSSVPFWFKENIGNHPIKYIASDGKETIDSTSTITVEEKVNTPPTITNFNPELNINGKEGDVINFSFNATDTDPLTYVITINDDTVATTNQYQWTAPASLSIIKGIATDGQLSDTVQWFAFIVNNQPPKITSTTPSRDTTINLGGSIWISALASDPDDVPTITYDTNGVSVQNPFWLKPLVGDHTVKYIASDNISADTVSRLISVVPSEYMLTGTTYDINGNIFPGITITYIDSTNNEIHTTVSDGTGQFSLVTKPSSGSLKVEHDTLDNFIQAPFSVTQDKNANQTLLPNELYWSTTDTTTPVNATWMKDVLLHYWGTDIFAKGDPMLWYKTDYPLPIYFPDSLWNQNQIDLFMQNIDSIETKSGIDWFTQGDSNNYKIKIESSGGSNTTYESQNEHRVTATVNIGFIQFPSNVFLHELFGHGLGLEPFHINDAPITNYDFSRPSNFDMTTAHNTFPTYQDITNITLGRLLQDRKDNNQRTIDLQYYFVK